MKKAFKFILLAGLLGGFVYTLFYLYKKNQSPDAVYDIEYAQIKDIKQKTVAAGSVKPRNEILMKPVVTGIIDEIFVEAGDYVKERQPIARIKLVPDMVNLNNAQNRVRQAKVQLRNAEIDYKRNKSLYEDKVIAAAEFQPFEVAYDNAKIELEAAEDNLSLIKDGVSRDIGDATNTIIRSTIEGMVLDIPVEKGDQVIEVGTFNEGTTIAEVADMGEMIFEGYLDEAEVGRVKVGMPLELSIGALQGEIFNATLEYIAPKGEDREGAIQFLIRAAVKKDDDAFIRAGYSANASIVLASREQVPSVNENVVEYESGKSYVYVQQDSQRFERTEVELGLSDGIYTEVVSGIITEDALRGKKRVEGEKSQASRRGRR